MEITRETARRLMIEKQRFGQHKKPVSKEDILETVRALGCIQIDTINVIERAHYVTLWSRFGRYDKEHENRKTELETLDKHELISRLIVRELEEIGEPDPIDAFKQWQDSQTTNGR